MSNIITADPNTLTLYQGKTFRVSFQVSDSAGQPQDLAGYGARFQILSRAGSTPPLLEVDDTMTGDSLDSGNTDAPVLVQPGTTPAIGLVQVRLGADQTLLLTRGGVYDCSIYSKTDSTEVQLLGGGPLVVVLVGGE